jgi:hypothetical protein
MRQCFFGSSDWKCRHDVFVMGGYGFDVGDTVRGVLSDITFRRGLRGGLSEVIG